MDAKLKEAIEREANAFVLWMDNERKQYDGRIVPLWRGMAARMKAGTYDREECLRAWEGACRAMADDYAKANDGKTVSREAWMAAAMMQRAHAETEIELGNTIEGAPWPVMIICACAKNDANGNPRRVFVALGADGGIVGTMDEGYSGDCVGRERWPLVPVGISIETTPAEYRRLVRIGEAIDAKAKGAK